MRHRVWAFAAVVAWAGCFPGPLKLDADGAVDGSAVSDGADVVDSAGDGDNGGDGVVVPDAGCRSNDDCKSLVTACNDAICQADGSCLALPKTGDACDDADACTRNDVCAAGTCAGTAYTCDDALACTSDVCDGAGGCLTQQLPSTCLIAGACYVAGEPKPDDPCLVCSAGTTWAASNSGACDDGDMCTTNDSCQAGVCAGGPPPSDEGTDWTVDPLGPQVAAGSFQGQILSDGLGVVVNAQRIYALDPQGGPRWSAAGALRIVARDASGLSWLGGACTEAASVNGVAVVVPPGDGQGCVFSVTDAGVVSPAIRVPAVPYGRFGDGSLLGLDGPNLVRHGLDGATSWRVELTLSVEGRVLDAAIGANDEVTLVAMSNGDVTATNGSSLTVPGPGLTAIIRIRADGSIAWASPLYRRSDFDFAFDFARVALHPGGDATIAGALHTRTAEFGFGADASEYTASGFYSLDPPEVGAGGDGYVARVDDTGRIRWLRYLRPLHDYGTRFVSASADGEAVLVAGSYDESALLTDASGGVVVSDVAGPADPYLPRPGSVIAKYGADGTLLWSRTHRGSAAAIGNGAHDPSVRSVVSLCVGDVGFDHPVPAATQDCRFVLLSINGRGGLDCAR